MMEALPIRRMVKSGVSSAQCRAVWHLGLAIDICLSSRSGSRHPASVQCSYWNGFGRMVWAHGEAFNTLGEQHVRLGHGFTVECGQWRVSLAALVCRHDVAAEYGCDMVAPDAWRRA